MRFVLFCHSLSSCWNHGNAHFLRGICRELITGGHEVVVYEPKDGWSRVNAVKDGGALALQQAAKLVPGVEQHSYRLSSLDLDRALEGADVVLVHEWNDPELVAALGRRRARGGGFTLLFHDTHHRGVSAPEEIARFDIEHYDGVLAFGEALREVYLSRGWATQVFTWHEAADTEYFRSIPGVRKARDLVWIGNWGDGERSRELREFLLDPVASCGLSARIHGVRYPDEVRQDLAERGIEFGGWLPNHQVPAAFAAARVTVHVPRRHYVEMLPGIPTIRVFEALACGIPLICAPWRDSEGLFPEGPYLQVQNQAEMTKALQLILVDNDLREALVAAGLTAIRQRHSCAHRVRELLAILDSLRSLPLARPVSPATQPLGIAQ
jgi:spore maturation protein CgeB